MDRFKNNIENVIFSNKTKFIKNRRQGNSGFNSGFNSGSNSGSNFKFDEIEYTSILLWILIIILIILISYLTVMTAKYLTTECSNKRSWFNYIFRFCYNDVCLVSKVPIEPVVNNVHFMKPNEVPPKIPNQPLPYNSNISSSNPIVDKQISISKSDQEAKKNDISIPLFGKKEVFHIANQDYTYEQAKCKCESYDSKLATYNQLVDAYNDGAEWCTYGWSSGQKAYYPTQKCNWEKKGPEERLKCGNPGLNGGFFADPFLKFGVNCYGKKPKGKVSKLKDPVCSHGKYCELPQNFGASNRLETDEIAPFNNNKWNN